MDDFRPTQQYSYAGSGGKHQTTSHGPTVVSPHAVMRDKTARLRRLLAGAAAKENPELVVVDEHAVDGERWQALAKGVVERC